MAGSRKGPTFRCAIQPSHAAPCVRALLALFGPHARSDLSPECAPKRTSATLNLWVHALASLRNFRSFQLSVRNRRQVVGRTGSIFRKYCLARAGFCDPKIVAPKRRFHEAIQRDLGRPVPNTKISSLVPSGKSTPLIPASCSHKRGASRSSRTLGAGCDGRGGFERRMQLSRTAKSCGPDTPTLVSSFGDCPRVTVAREPGHRGEHEGNRSNHCAGNAVMFRRTCGDYACVLSHFRTQGCGCAKHPAFPAPSYRG